MRLSQLRKAIKDNKKAIYIPKDTTKVTISCAWCGESDYHEKWNLEHKSILICPHCNKPYSLHWQPQCEGMKHPLGIEALNGTVDQNECDKISDQQRLNSIDNYIGSWYSNWHFTIWWGADDIAYDLKMEAGKEYRKILSPEFNIDDEKIYVELWLKCHDFGARSTTRQEYIKTMKKWLVMLKQRKAKGNAKISDMRMIKALLKTKKTKIVKTTRIG